MPPRKLITDDRTTARGLYHYAQSFREAADALEGQKARATHPNAPRSFLYHHAIELFLKALLRNAGRSVDHLRKIGHDYSKLAAEFEAAGGLLMDEDRDVIRTIADHGTWERSRYIVTGPFTAPTSEALSRTAESLAETVCRELAKTDANLPMKTADLSSTLRRRAGA